MYALERAKKEDFLSGSSAIGSLAYQKTHVKRSFLRYDPASYFVG